jgi:hypothetical protein
VKNLTNVLAFIEAPINDGNIVIMTLNGLGKYYSQFRSLIRIRKTFFNFQKLITLLISENMRIVDISSNGGLKKNSFYSNISGGKSRSRGGKTSS